MQFTQAATNGFNGISVKYYGPLDATVCRIWSVRLVMVISCVSAGKRKFGRSWYASSVLSSLSINEHLGSSANLLSYYCQRRPCAARCLYLPYSQCSTWNTDERRCSNPGQIQPHQVTYDAVSSLLSMLFV